MKKVIVLGSTGSIGINTLDIIRAYRQDFSLTALSCYRSLEKLNCQIKEFSPQAVSYDTSIELPSSWNYSGYTYNTDQALLEMIRETDADIVVNGIAGAKGLLPSIAALESGKDLALANKETIVMAGDIVGALAKEKGRKILPVDSEHFAVFQLLRKTRVEDVAEIILTASGGAVRDIELKDLDSITPEMALKHPNWSMGPKITIDSATMANKGLEVIEAWRLFSLPLKAVKVVIHPQSIVHSLIKTKDSAYYAQLGKPDMRIPILGALSYPENWFNPFEDFDLTENDLTFNPVEKKKYPLLLLAYDAATLGGYGPVVYNAANEVAVDAFIHKKIGFTQIPLVVEKTLEKITSSPVNSIEEILYIDKKARKISDEILKSM